MAMGRSFPGLKRSGREADYSPVKVQNASATPALSHTPSYSVLVYLYVACSDDACRNSAVISSMHIREISYWGVLLKIVDLSKFRQNLTKITDTLREDPPEFPST
jgi:hypothetical protein